jgi:uncharacterized membrane protein
MSVQEPPQQQFPEPVPSTEQRNWTMAVWLLYLGGHITVVTVIAGLIIAYMKRDAFAGTPYQSHMVSAIRTFWISLVVGLVGILLVIVGVGIFILIGLVIWTIFRCVRGLVRAINGQPIDNPTGWL